MALRAFIGANINRVFSRTFHLSSSNQGADSREKRIGHKEKSDKVDGEYGSLNAPHSSFEFIDENLLDRVINNVKFRNIPVVTMKCTRNNTKITVTLGDGTVLASKSAGTEGYKNCRKGTTVAAQSVASRVLTILKDNEIKMARMVFDGLGPGRNAAFRVFELDGLNIVSLTDRTQAAEPWNQRPRGRKSI